MCSAKGGKDQFDEALAHCSTFFCNLCLRSGAEMGVFGGTPPPTCPSSRHCAEWARTYLKYCLCSQKDSAALALGLISVISWGVAEVPQIITNYRQKSTEGLSIAFLMTWIVGYAVPHVFCSSDVIIVVSHVLCSLDAIIFCHDNCSCTPMLCEVPCLIVLILL